MRILRKHLFGTTVLAGLLALSLPAQAQTAPAGQATPAGAQSPEAGEATDVEEVVVTGSRLRRDTFDTPTPVVTVDEQEFVRTGAGNVIDVLANIGLAGVASDSRGSNSGQYGLNFSFIDLFNLGSQRTLTLVNGRRFVSGNQGTVFVPGNATGAQVDLTVIPPSLVERVEVIPLTGGAVYGADAVGGVVNFLLKDDFDGLDVGVQYGVTDQGDGDRYRATVTWGTNFYENRANVTLAGDYYRQDLITTGPNRPYNTDAVGLVNNVLNGGVRNPDFSQANLIGAALGGAALPSVFLAASADLQPSTWGARNIFSNVYTANGLLTTGNNLPTGVATSSYYLPATPVAAAFALYGQGANGLPVFAPSALPGGWTAARSNAVVSTFAPGVDTSGLSGSALNTLALRLLQANLPTPREYFDANPNVNPLAIIGSLYGAQGNTPGAGPSGLYPTIANPDAATSALFPRLAVPLQFDSNGALTPFNIGDPRAGYIGTGVGSDGYDGLNRGYGNLLSQTERYSLAALTRFDITDSITYRGEFLYANIEYRSVGAPLSNVVSGSPTAGNRSIPIYIDQNPYFGSANLAEINALVAQGLTVPTINGQRVLFVNRGLQDIFDGPSRSGNDVETFRTAHSLEGEFGVWNRRFYWDASYVYGQHDILNFGQDLYDIEFALASDVVIGPNGQPVCRQQTLSAPESIAIRNPGVGNINTTLSLTPTAAQVAACVPFNPLGESNSTITNDLRNYVLTDSNSNNEARQHYLQASLGGEIFRLPGGWISAGAQIEWRNESLKFTAGQTPATGAGRTTTVQDSQGELRFLEYGYELLVPIFGGDFTLPGVKALELSGAYRIVDRDQETVQAGFAQSPGTTDEVWQASVRWVVNDDLQLRANTSTSVRSASIIELFGAPSTGFGTGTIPCSPSTIDSGPNPAVRRANCIQAVILTGAAPDAAAAEAFLSTWVQAGGSRPAASASNAFLNNEESEAYGYGFTFTPRWIPRLAIAWDYFNAEVTGRVGLVNPSTTFPSCFDQAEFPNSSLSGTPACDMLVFGVRGPAGNYIVPSINPLTGNPVHPAANPGGPAQVNAPFDAAFIFYPNFNLAATKLAASTLEVRYNFALEELVGSRATRWGNLFLSGSLYNLIRYDTSGTGTFQDTLRYAGDHGYPKWSWRADVTHRVGPLDHRLSWFRNGGTVTDSQANPALRPEQSLTFRRDGYDRFNYSIGYQVRDEVSVRLTVNNLLNTKAPYEEYGLVADTIGRTYLFSVNGRF